MSYHQPDPASVGAVPAPQPAPSVPQQPQQQPAGWYPDPFGRHDTRWWDGANWTEHVASNGRQAVDPPGGASHVPTENRRPDQIVRNVQEVGGASGQGGGTIFTEPVLVVSQKAKLIEVNQEFAVYDQHGRQIGAVRQVGQSAAKKAVRVLTKWDAFMSHKFQIVDAYGNVLLALHQPAKFVKSKIMVHGPAGEELGQIAQENAFGKIRFALESGGQQWGSINAENWRAWNFSIQDHTGAEIARITKKWAGLKAAFTTADNYVVQIHRPLEDPLRSLVVAAAVGVDAAIHQYQG